MKFMPYCPNCGNKIDETMTFCPECGVPLKIEAPTRPAPPPPYRRTAKNEEGMTEDAKEIENLLSKLHSGIPDERFSALLGISIKSKSSLDESLKEEMRRHLVPIVTGQIQTDLQSGCFAAIALAVLGDHSQDVATPLFIFLRYYAEDPVKFSGPMDEFISSSNLLCFTVHVVYALSLFKGDGKIVSFLIDIIARCHFPKSGEDRIKNVTGVDGPQFKFYDSRIKNLVSACLRSIGAIGESGTEDGVKMLELWSSRGNVTAKAALELFGSSWTEIVRKETELEKVAITDNSSDIKEDDEIDENKGKGKDVAEKISKILNLCETNPDELLELIKVEKSNNPLLKWAKAMAYGGKGLFKALGALNLDDGQLLEASSWEARDFREKLRLTDEQLDYLEVALREVREIEMVTPGFVAMIGTDEEPIGEAKVDAIASALERCRPGKVQELMGTTKLLFFGSAHRRMGVRPGLDLTSKDYAILLNPRFSAPLVVKAAIAMDKGADGKGRRFVTCLLYQKCLDEWGPDETLETASSAGVLYFFDDGSWHHSNDTKRVFLCAIRPGLSLPP